MSDNKFNEKIFDEVIFGSLIGTAFFAVEGLLKLAHDQNERLSQLEDLEEGLLKLAHDQNKMIKKMLSQRKEEH